MFFRKITSGLRLLRGEDGFAQFNRHLRRNSRQIRLKLSGGRNLIYWHRLGTRFVASRDDPELRGHYLDQDHDLFESKIMHAWVEWGDHVIDCGANVGLFSSLLSRLVGPSGRVLAIEASPQTYYCLVRNLNALGLRNVTPLHACVCDDSRIVQFDVASSEAVRHAVAEPSVDRKLQVVDVSGMRLDTLLSCSNLKNPSLVKVDIEGSEPLALKGTTTLLSSADLPLFIVEVYPTGLNRLRFTPADVLAWFPVEKFELWHINFSWPNISAEFPRNIPLRLTEPSTHRWPLATNLIAIPRTGVFSSRKLKLSKVLKASR
jgi:FkbM family methyltransferase